MAESTPKGADAILTPANVVTLVRICLVPVFVAAIISPWPDWLGIDELYEWKSWIAAGVFVIISCTDWLDGYLARKRNEVTDFGKFVDPLADKILVIAALLVLVELGALPSWVVLIIVAREFIVSGVRMVAANKGEVIAASWYGKFKTVFQMIAIVLFVIKESPVIAEWSEFAYDVLYMLSWAVMLVALVLTVVSMLDYISKARHLIGFPSRRGSKPSSSQASASSSASESSSVPSASGKPTLSNPSPASDSSCALRAENIEESVVRAAKERGLLIGTAESCTGGLIAAAITNVPGSSAVFNGAIVSYANEVKRDRLGVDELTLDRVGAVSEEVACQMAEGARSALSVDVSVSVTGIAGPGGAVAGKPVGTVWIGVSSESGTRARLHHFDGDRDAVRRQTVSAALSLMLSEITR